MNGRIVPLLEPDPDPTLSPEQQIAAAVIHQAILDAKYSQSAERFLAGHDRWLHFWAAVAGLDPQLIVRRWQAYKPINRGRWTYRPTKKCTYRPTTSPRATSAGPDGSTLPSATSAR